MKKLFGIIIACFGVIIPMFKGVIVCGLNFFGIIGTGSDFFGTIGTSGDCKGILIPWVVSRFGVLWPDLKGIIHTGYGGMTTGLKGV